MKKLATLILLFLGVATLTSQATAADIATLIVAKGEVEVNFAPVKLPMSLKEGDLVTATGSKSFFIVSYPDKSRFLIKDGSIKIKKLENKVTTLQLSFGHIFSYVNPESKQKFSVQTPTASFGVRGTKFWLQHQEKESYLCVCDGKVAVTKGNQSVTVERKEDLHVYSSQELPEKTQANDMMWKMTLEGFEKLGVETTP